MIVKPEDRADQVARLMSKGGGKLLAYYVTFGEYDFLSIAEAPSETTMAAILLAAGSPRRRHRPQDDRGADVLRGHGRLCRSRRSGARL